MARTAKKTLPIYKTGILLIGDANSINFTGSGVAGSVDGLGNVTENISGGAPGTFVQEIPTGSGTSFTLAHTPISVLLVTARGQVLYPSGGNQGYSITGTTITTNDSWATGDLLVTYYY